jgi:hypothetical protein
MVDTIVEISQNRSNATVQRTQAEDIVWATLFPPLHP